MPLSADRKYEIACNSWGARPPASITWWKGNTRLQSSRQTVIYNLQSISLLPTIVSNAILFLLYFENNSNNNNNNNVRRRNMIMILLLLLL